MYRVLLATFDGLVRTLVTEYGTPAIAGATLAPDAAVSDQAASIISAARDALVQDATGKALLQCVLTDLLLVVGQHHALATSNIALLEACRLAALPMFLVSNRLRFARSHAQAITDRARLHPLLHPLLDAAIAQNRSCRPFHGEATDLAQVRSARMHNAR